MAEINTFSKHKIDPCNPKIDDIRIEDIAHALSLVTRSGGHFPTFYSVARHSVWCFLEAKSRGKSADVCKFCLFHDGSEAYLADITSPVKANLPDYIHFEKQLQDLIYTKFVGRTPSEEERIEINKIDKLALLNEFNTIMGIRLEKGIPDVFNKIDCRFYGFEHDEKAFLNEFLNSEKK